jgi:FkbM family methyltransferase
MDFKMGDRRVILSIPQDSSTCITFKEIFLDDIYQLRRVREPVRKVLDIGAHAGLFSLQARRLFPQAEIHAYEPNPALWKHLEVQASSGAFKVFREAVGARAGQARLLFGTDSTSTRAIQDIGGMVTVVPISTAVGRLGGMIDVLKLDCEGAEWEILTDQASMDAVRFITLEYHLSQSHTFQELIGLLTGQGFAVFDSSDKSEAYGIIVAKRNR